MTERSTISGLTIVQPFQNLWYYSNAAFSESLILLVAGVLSVIFPLNLNDSVFVMVLFGSFLCYCHKRPVFA